MIINTWNNFNKRKNSTKRPEESQATARTVRLKENTSIENPIFILTGNNYDLNYIQAFNHYYFVTDIISINNAQCEVHCEQDLLATYKEAIQNTTAFINYSSTGYSRNILDSRIACLATKNIRRQRTDIEILNTTGCYILSVANNQGGYSGFASQYVLTSGVLSDIADKLFSDSFIEALIMQFTNPMNSILNCVWLPFDYATAVDKTVAANVFFGKEDSGVLARAINTAQTVIGRTYIVNIPWQYNDFRRQSPYTTASLYIPYYGSVEINMSDLIGEESLTVAIAVDIANGDVMTVIFGSTTGAYLQTLTYNIAVNCPISQVTNNMTGVTSGIAGSLGGMATAGLGLIAGASSGVIAGGIGAMLLGAGSAVLESNKRTTSTKGSIQGRASNAYGNGLQLSLFSQNTENPDSAEFIATNGRPVMKTGVIGDYSGYIQTSNASVNIPGMSNDKNVINYMLNSGIYLE